MAGSTATARRHWDTRTLVTLALLAAIGVILSFIEGSPFGNWLKYDASFVPAAIAGFVFGPSAGAAVGAVTAVIHGLVMGNFWGALMNLVGVIFFVVPAAAIYRKMASRAGAAIGLLVGAVLTIVVMLLLNIVVTPLYTPSVTAAQVVQMIVPILLPFNVFKAVVNSIIVFILYGSVEKMAQRGAKKKA